MNATTELAHGSVTDDPMNAKTKKLLTTWQEAEERYARAYLPDDIDRTGQAVDDAWNAFYREAADNNLCQTCGRHLSDMWPWANCYDHEPTDHRVEWDEYRQTGAWA